jgi:hypothetical protein
MGPEIEATTMLRRVLSINCAQRKSARRLTMGLDVAATTAALS